MEGSILNTIKKLLLIPKDCVDFDTDLIVAINTAFSTLYQMGVGTDKPFSINDDTAVWSDFMESNDDMEMVKTYIHLKVKMIFDPPQSSAVIEVYKDMTKEYETRLYMMFNPRNISEDEDE